MGLTSASRGLRICAADLVARAIVEIYLSGIVITIHLLSPEGARDFVMGRGVLYHVQTQSFFSYSVLYIALVHDWLAEFTAESELQCAIFIGMQNPSGAPRG